MEKTKDIKIFNNYVKYYNSGEKKSVFEIIEQLKSNGVVINLIKIKEDVEGDMKTVDGTECTEQEFRENFNYYVTHMLDGYFKIDATLNDEPFTITVYDSKPVIVLSSPEEGLEIDDLISKKKVESTQPKM